MSLGGKVRQEVDPSSEEEEEEEDKKERNLDTTLVGTVGHGSGRGNMIPVLEGLSPSLYNGEYNGEYTQWWREFPESICDVMIISQHITSTHDLGRTMEANDSLLGKGEVRVRGICKFPDDDEEVVEDDSMHTRNAQPKRISIENMKSEETPQFTNVPRRGRKDGCVKDYAQLDSYVQIEARQNLYEDNYNDRRVSTSHGGKANDGGWSQNDAHQCWNEIQTLWDEKGRSCLEFRPTKGDTSEDEEKLWYPSTP